MNIEDFRTDVDELDGKLRHYLNTVRLLIRKVEGSKLAGTDILEYLRESDEALSQTIENLGLVIDELALADEDDIDSAV